MLSILKKSHKGLPRSPHVEAGLQRGFTLIEMLVVIAIISILIGIGVNTFTIAQKKARDVRRKADLTNIKKALIAYGLDKNGNYQCGATPANCTVPATLLETTYLSKVPTDPINTGSYVYTFLGTTTGFKLEAHLENLSDPDVTTIVANCVSATLPAGAYCQTSDQ